MDNRPGTVGICYDVYNLSGDEGYAIIFPNGEYCGFAKDELNFFEDYSIGFSKKASTYTFKNVMQLCRDFKGGFFDF